jgi:hypothetical protein
MKYLAKVMGEYPQSKKAVQLDNTVFIHNNITPVVLEEDENTQLFEYSEWQLSIDEYEHILELKKSIEQSLITQDQITSDQFNIIQILSSGGE